MRRTTIGALGFLAGACAVVTPMKTSDGPVPRLQWVDDGGGGGGDGGSEYRVECAPHRFLWRTDDGGGDGGGGGGGDGGMVRIDCHGKPPVIRRT